MAAQNNSTLARIARSGMGVIPPAVGLIALHSVLSIGNKGPQVHLNSLKRTAKASLDGMIELIEGMICITAGKRCMQLIANPFNWGHLLGSAPKPPDVFEIVARSKPDVQAATALATHPRTSKMPTPSLKSILAEILGIVTAVLGTEVSRLLINTTRTQSGKAMFMCTSNLHCTVYKLLLKACCVVPSMEQHDMI